MRRRKTSPAQSATLLFSALRSALATWKAAGTIKRCYFVRKPPDVRLRFECGAFDAEPELVAWLDARAAEGTIARWTRACYEPEVALLGGAELLPHVHTYFDADTRAFMDFAEHHGTPLLSTRDPAPAGPDPAAPRAQAGLSAPALSLSVLNDLFLRAVDGREEIWDVWWNLSSLHGSSPIAPKVTTSAIQIDDLLGRVPSYDERVLKAYRRANATFARKIRQLAAKGQLPFGRRSILPFVALFHWNRYGLPLEERARVLSAMLSAWDPGLRFHGRFDPCRVP